MGVGVQGESSGEMTQHTAYRLDVHTVLKCNGCEGVANSWNSIFNFYCTISWFFEINQEIALFYSPCQ